MGLMKTSCLRPKRRFHFVMVPCVLALISFIWWTGCKVQWKKMEEGPRPLGWIAFAFAWHVFMSMIIWSYLTVVFTDPGTVTSELSDALRQALSSHQIRSEFPGICYPTLLQDKNIFGDIEAGGSAVPSPAEPHVSFHLVSRAAAVDGGDAVALPSSYQVTNCKRCNGLRPPRSHHCSSCEKCILKLDHHCVFVANCVGQRNQKPFILFLSYAALGCGLGAILFVHEIIKQWEDGPLPSVVIAGFFSIQLSLSLGSFACLHWFYAAAGGTAMENPQPYKNGEYSLGVQRNLTAVFGQPGFSWLFPFDTSEGHYLTSFDLGTHGRLRDVSQVRMNVEKHARSQTASRFPLAAFLGPGSAESNPSPLMESSKRKPAATDIVAQWLST